jgi:hypothetical protein
MTWLIALLGLTATALGGWLAVDPESSPAAAFPPLNEHLIHDSAAAFLAFGIGLLIAARLPAWRLPVLALAALWSGLHTIAHIVDVNSAETRTAGVTAVVELAVLTVALAALALWSSRSSR